MLSERCSEKVNRVCMYVSGDEKLAIVYRLDRRNDDRRPLGLSCAGHNGYLWVKICHVVDNQKLKIERFLNSRILTCSLYISAITTRAST